MVVESDHLGLMFGYLGAMSCLVLSCLGAAYGTAQAGLGLTRAGARDPNMIIRIIPSPWPGSAASRVSALDHHHVRH